jgi:hypothetical protein
MVATTDLTDIFLLDPTAWSPRKAVYRVAATWAQDRGAALPSDREVFAALRSRGFRESKRRGVYGFNGIRTLPELAELPRLSLADVPGTANAYKHGDRSRESLDALLVERSLRRAAARGDLPVSAEPRDPFVLPDRALPLEQWFDGYSASTRVTSVLRARAEKVHGPRHSWTCYHGGCRVPATTVDHIIPWSESHDSTPHNLRPSCPRHNFSRGARADDAHL